MTWWKKIKELELKNNELITKSTEHKATIDDLTGKYEKLKDEYVRLESRHKEILKRQPNIEQLLLALRDLETGAAVIRISRIDQDRIFEWNPR